MTTTSGGRQGDGAKAPPSRPSAGPGTVVPPAGVPYVPRQRRLRLTVTRIDPWTVLRLSFLLSIATAIITVVALVPVSYTHLTLPTTPYV